MSRGLIALKSSILSILRLTLDDPELRILAAVFIGLIAAAVSTLYLGGVIAAVALVVGIVLGWLVTTIVREP